VGAVGPKGGHQGPVGRCASTAMTGDGSLSFASPSGCLSVTESREGSRCRCPSHQSR
jgi:hypothetical protein